MFYKFFPIQTIRLMALLHDLLQQSLTFRLTRMELKLQLVQGLLNVYLDV